MANAITYQQLSLAARFSTLLFPFDAMEFFRLLASNGYVLEERIAEAPFGAQVEVSGFVARRAGVAVRLDTNRQVFGVHSPNPKEIAETMEALESSLLKEMALDVSKISQFYELVANGTVSTKINPLSSWKKRGDADELVKKFAGIIGKPVIPFGLKVATSQAVPNSTDWFEVEITPHVINPSAMHNFHIVYRNANRDDVMKFTLRVEAVVRDVAKTVEEQ